MAAVLLPRRAPSPGDLIRILVPEEDRWALTPESREAKLREEARKRELLSERLREPSAHELRNAIEAKCALDPIFFAKNFIWSQDPENRIGLGQELPFIPFQYLLKRRPAPPGFGDGRPLGGWIGSWHQALLARKRARLCHTKSRRARFSISTSIMNVWGLRFWSGWKALIGSDEDGAVDNAAGDWNSILGKIRYIWRMCNVMHPWLFPPLPDMSKTPFNKKDYIKFPQDVDRERFAPFMDNEIAGVLPSDVAKRGGAALATWIDEAAWVKKLNEFLETAGPMSTLLVLGSTPPEDTSHIFQKIAEGLLDWPTDAVHFLMDPVLLEGLRWDVGGEHRGPWTQHWRTNLYDQILREEESSSVARNYDINPQATAQAPVFLSFDPTTQVSSEDPTHADYDLYNPDLPLWLYADVGWGDPWAVWWVQTSDATGEINLVDFWMRAGVHAEWWVPLFLGWDPDEYRGGEPVIKGGALARWRNVPERMKWTEAVPQSYGEEDFEVMRYWRNKVRPRGLIIDASGTQHHGASRWSVVERLQQYGNLNVIPVTMAHHMEDMISHANLVLRRARLSGRIAKRRPKSGGKTWVSPLNVLTNWKRLEATERGSPAKPTHDDHSHGGTALVYGLSQVPQTLEVRGKAGFERNVPRTPRGYQSTYSDHPDLPPIMGGVL